MKVELKDKERIDDLQRNGYQIIQNPEKFCFGMDAVLLTGFANAREKDILLDLGTGTGIIPLLMEAKYHCSHLTGLEIQEESADMARRSVALNRRISLFQQNASAPSSARELRPHRSRHW